VRILEIRLSNRLFNIMAGSGLRDWWVVSRLRSLAGEEVGALVAPVSFEPGGFNIFGRVFSAEGPGGRLGS
jgi:hypothetical protein